MSIRRYVITCFVIFTGMAGFYRDAQAADPVAMQWYNQGVVATRQHNASLATRYFEQATHADPFFTSAWYNLGVCQYTSGDYPHAADSFQRVLNQNPNDAQAFQNLQKARARLVLSPNTATLAQPAKAGVRYQYPAVSQTALQADDQLVRPRHGFVSPKPPVQTAHPIIKLPANVEQVYPAPTGTGAEASVAAGSSGGRWFRRKATRLAGGFRGPTGMAITAGGGDHLYVANYLRNEIYRVSPQTGEKKLFVKDGLSGPVGMVWNPKRQELYVANYQGNTISRVTENGTVLPVVKNLHKPYLLMLDVDKQILYVSEQGTNSVSKVPL